MDRQKLIERDLLRTICQLVAAAEREACVKVLEEEVARYADIKHPQIRFSYGFVYRAIKNIRQRHGETSLDPVRSDESIRAVLDMCESFSQPIQITSSKARQWTDKS
jgi:hypothetical protein